MNALDTALFTALRERARAACEGREPAHDFSHVERVVANAARIADEEIRDGRAVDRDVCVLAALLHELVTYAKNDPRSPLAGDVCADAARDLFRELGVEAHLADHVCAAIRDHAFSKGVTPSAIEACILQDADRLDAIGAVGIARCFATSADMKRPFFAPNDEDPFCHSRAPDDKRYGLDHVFKKLLLLPSRMHTESARRLAVPREAAMRAWLASLEEEIFTYTEAGSSARRPETRR